MGLESNLSVTTTYPDSLILGDTGRQTKSVNVSAHSDSGGMYRGAGVNCALFINLCSYKRMPLGVIRNTLKDLKLVRVVYFYSKSLPTMLFRNKENSELLYQRFQSFNFELKMLRKKWLKRNSFLVFVTSLLFFTQQVIIS